MTYRIKKLKLNSINIYLESLNKLKKKISLNQIKINKLNHYNWWFENKDFYKFSLEKNNKKLIFFWFEKKIINKKKYFFAGWWPVIDRLNMEDYFFITKYLIKLSYNCIHVAIILKKNIFSLKLHKYFDFKKISNNSEDFKNILFLKKNKNLNKKNNYVVMIRR